ncbi:MULTISPECIES: autotransporter outer membrane beta-barrel domain-containing protein [Thalassospira]|uniref:Autotransporter domain-containing protein n=1 Tax=Thalassospira aquimaris TaxID=3037796 RepID=A0ABT6G837_9PROT|nr:MULTISPECIES: autotransporter outer membrane beta-barrel domain-containing protein [Thalassospira]MDG4718209.1 autotransporter domain-containing protein [Thalassospira sp. FZY0004]
MGSTGATVSQYVICAFGLLLATASFSDAEAAKCGTSGGLIFLGKTAGDTNSVWLSGTSAGTFRLDANGTTKDTWDQSRRGLHLTLSDVVSSGNGGTHHLYDNSGSGCLLDSQNQKGGVNLPPIGDLFPDFVMPELPGGVTPPIATLPPTGLMPGLPPGFAPPIGILPPPEGLMPGRPPIGGFQLPEGTTPPIATLPPSLPGTGNGVTPPIGTVPPQGVMPTIPGGVTPPIATLPPGLPGTGNGVTPPIGTVPPQGVMPTIPGGVTPPIATLPPSLPGTGNGVTPPIGTVPPQGVMPTIPGGVTPPIGTLPGGNGGTGGGTGGGVGGNTLPPTIVSPNLPGVSEVVATTELAKNGGDFLPNDNCAVLDTDGQLYRTENGLVYTAPCELIRNGGYQGVTVASISVQSDVPLTPGREFIDEPLWNFWSETRGVYARDRRHDLDSTGFSGSFLAGADKEIAEGTVAGISASFESSTSEGFDGSLETQAFGMSVGPYVAHRLSPEWAVQGSLGYMVLNNDLDVVVLEGEYLSHQLSAATAINGQYRYEEWTLRPRFGVSYAETFVEDYDLSGTISGTPVKVNVGSDHFGYGEAEISGEASKLLVLSDDLIGMPYGELGLHYAFERPNDGRILSGNLTYEDTSPVTGSLRGGMRFIYDDSIYFDVGGGYLSIGQNGLNVWEAKAHISFAF